MQELFKACRMSVTA